MSVGFDELRDKNPEWLNFVVFNGAPSVLFQTLEVRPDELAEFISLFDDYDTTVSKGATLGGLHFHVQRFYEGLVCGRADRTTKKTDGFCLYRTIREGKTPLYVFITYDLPDVSARVIPLLAKQIEEIKDQLD
jgi:hypothetical protein